MNNLSILLKNITRRQLKEPIQHPRHRPEHKIHFHFIILPKPFQLQIALGPHFDLFSKDNQVGDQMPHKKPLKSQISVVVFDEIDENLVDFAGVANEVGLHGLALPFFLYFHCKILELIILVSPRLPQPL